MNFKKFSFIDFESKNPLTQKTYFVLLMAVTILVVEFIIMSIIIVFPIIISEITSPEVAQPDFFESDSFLIISLFLTLINIALTLAYVKFAEKRSLSSMGITKQNVLSRYGSGYLLGILMIGLPALTLLLFNGSVQFSQKVNYGIILLYILGFIVQGASDEIMIRGFLLTSLVKASNMFWAILISSFGFALLHMLNPNMGILPFINLVLFGVFASLFFLRTKNIWAISAIHSAWNFFQGNVFGIKVSGQTLNTSVFSINSSAPVILSGGDFGLEGGLLVTALLAAASLITAFYGDNKLIAKNSASETNQVNDQAV